MVGLGGTIQTPVCCTRSSDPSTWNFYINDLFLNPQKSIRKLEVICRPYHSVPFALKYEAADDMYSSYFDLPKQSQVVLLFISYKKVPVLMKPI